MASRIRLHCILTNEPKETSSSSDSFEFEPQANSKTSFRFEPPSTDGAISLDKPAHVLIQCSRGETRVPFSFGGLELTSNARNVEAYIVPEGKHDHQEDYLLTARGTAVEEDWHKCVVVCPNGPETVRRIHLKLLSLRPAKTVRATLTYVTLKGRLPEPEIQSNGPVSNETATQNSTNTTATAAQSAEATMNSGSERQPPLPAPQPPALTGADITAAMTGVSMMVRGVETRILTSIRDHAEQMQSSWQSHVEKSLGATLQQHHSQVEMLLRQQSEFLQQQQTQVQQQQEMIRQLRQEQTELTSAVSLLQSQLEKHMASQDSFSSRPPTDETAEESNGNDAEERELTSARDKDSASSCSEDGHNLNQLDLNQQSGNVEGMAELSLNDDDQSEGPTQAPSGETKRSVMEQHDHPVELPDLTPIPDDDLLGLEDGAA